MSIKRTRHVDVAKVGAWLSGHPGEATNTAVRYTALAELVKLHIGVDISPETLSSLCVSLGYRERRDSKPKKDDSDKNANIAFEESIKAIISILAKFVLDYSVDSKLLVNGERESAIRSLKAIVDGSIYRKAGI